MGTAVLPPETIVPACPRVKLRPTQIPGMLHARGAVIPPKWLEALEQNQQLASCCRHPENHEIEAFRSAPNEQVDIYIMHCTCGRQHRRFCCGGSKGFKVDHLGEYVLGADGKPLPIDDLRPFWQ